MALINCEECGREVSDRARSCPHCGFPVKCDEPEVQHIETSIVDLPSDSELIEKRQRINYAPLSPVRANSLKPPVQQTRVVVNNNGCGSGCGSGCLFIVIVFVVILIIVSAA